MLKIINNIYLICILLLSLPINATENNRSNIISVGLVAGGWGPFQQWNGKSASGFSVELMEQLATKLDYQIAWHSYPSWESMYSDACTGNLDIMLDAFNTEPRQCITYSLPYYTSPTVVVVRQDSKLFTDVNRLKSATIAIEKGFLTERLVKLHYPEVTQRLFIDTPSALLAVERGDADAYIGNIHVANQFIQSHPMLVVVAQSPLLMETLHLGVTSRKQSLSVQLNTAIEALTIETRSELELRWLGDSSALSYMGQSAFLLHPDERKWLESLQPMKVGLIPGWEPFSYQDKNGNSVGLIYDYLSLLREKLGLAYQYIDERNRVDLQQQLLHHDIDLTVLPVRVVKRLVGWHASEPFVSFPVVLVTARGSPTIGDINDLMGKHLLLTDGMLIPQIKALAPNIKLTTTPSAMKGLDLLASGVGDAYIGNLVVLSSLIEKKYDGRLKIAAPTPFRDELAVAVREPYEPLLPLVNRVLLSMSDKDKRQIRNSWLALNYSEGISIATLLRTLLPAGVVVALFILVLFVAYWRLRKEIVYRQQIEVALASAKVKAEIAANQKGEFLATMSHEIRTPMNGIVGMAEQLTFTELTLDQRQMVEVINCGARSLHALLDNVLDLAKLEAGKMHLEQVPFLVRDMLDNLLAMTVSEIHRKGLNVYVWTDAAVAARCIGDPLRLRQILFNFVSNAVKFTERGFVEISVRALTHEEGKQQLQFGVHDSGIGISPEALKRIFNTFEQAETTTTRSYGGSGLGLSISRSLATLMGGEIQIDSTKGRGTFISLVVTLPVLAQREPDPYLEGHNAHVELNDEKLKKTLQLHLHSLGVVLTHDQHKADLCFCDYQSANGGIQVLPFPTPLGYRREGGRYLLNSSPMTWHAVREVSYHQLGLKEELRLQVHQRPLLSQPLLPYRILLVEDNPLNQTLLIRQLRELQLSCDLAEDGQQALIMVEQYPYDMVLCDCQMPIMDGYEFTRKVRARENDERLLIIAMTANVLSEQTMRCFTAGMDDVLHKPVLFDVLRQMLEKWHILPSTRLLDLTLIGNQFGRGEQLSQTLRQFGNELEQALAQQPIGDKDVANWVHRNAGTISMMMLPGVAEQAWQLEEQIRINGVDTCLDELASFRQLLIQLLYECNMS
ncbi:ATP-binding protein [Vibrio cholerae]